MEKDILLTKEEIEYLRVRLLAQYDKIDKEKNGGLELNTHKRNYDMLAKKLTELIQNTQIYGNTYVYKSIGTSQLLAFIHGTNQGNPKSFLTEACYQYIHGEKRKHFFQSKEGKILLEEWRNQGAFQEENFDTSEKKIIEETLEDSKTEAENTLVVAETWTKQPPIQTSFGTTYSRIIAAVVLGLLCLSTYFAIKYYNKYTLEHQWATPKIEEEVALKKRLSFVEDADFQGVVLDCLNSLELQYAELLRGHIKTNPSNELIYYKNEKNSEELELTSYHFYTGFASWWSDNTLTLGLQDTLHTLFDHLVDSSYIKPKNSSPSNPRDPFFVKNFLKVKSETIQPISMFTVFKNEKTSLIVRYPPFKEHRVSLDNYLLDSRQWFQNAYHTDKYTLERNERINWHWKNRKGTLIEVGLSEPFLSVRKGTPLQRALWFKIPTQKNDYFLFCITMILNN